MRPILLLLGMALATAGCSPEATQSPAAPTRVTAPAGAIPVALQGRYALRPADCDPARGDVRGLLTIGEDAIAFGVAPLTVDRVAPRADRVTFDVTEIDADVTATRRYAFRVSPDRARLTRLEAGQPDRVYSRCAAPAS